MIFPYVAEKPSTWSQYIFLITYIFNYNNSVHQILNIKPTYIFLGFEGNFSSGTLFVNITIDKYILDKIRIKN